ncbi:Alpha-maltose-1-phosphate synthase [Pontiella desulfatans]|uniref:Alpha-maltose-1-phosphate synthase n=1 Tax=Pontiella desulfatans TaxID=2750659 RepID=A0A6C2UC49_PONDE|nr:glycosyltransferase family 4 protein [Pontiella desulfatans]VGO17529.1 Alpha-maltose-1-phosphate synthase [Pontiella desulfatans]
MKVVHIVPGSGGTFYCQNCMRDGALVQALRRAGEDVVMVPMYLPMFTDGDPVQDDTPVFFGGINVWLQQQVPFFRKTPRWLDRLFDSKWMLRRAAQMEGTTSASDLGAMTLSMLEGTAGNQKKEVERLVDWLAEHERPDVVHISNALLIGLAGEIKAKLDVPVVCSLQDEDWWLDEINPPYDEQCWDAIRARCGDVDRFVAVSNWFADQMSERLMVPRDVIDVVHIGIDLDGFGPAPLDFDPPVLGYLSRMNTALGIDKLVDAFIELKKVPGLETLKLRATGGAVGDDLKCVEEQKRKLAKAGLAEDAEFVEDFTREQRLAFLKTISVMCVPVEQGEAFGSFIIESMAAGVPVVQPKAGAFPELVEATGGGVVYDNLVEELEALLLNPDRARALGAQGRDSVYESFSVESMAQNMVAVYRELAK